MPNDQLTDISMVCRDIETARGLPNAHYTDAAVYNEERQALWFSTWAGIGVGADIPETGDAKPIDYLGVPLFMIRSKDGDIRVFQNICRHRGMTLISEPRKIEGAIRCPYHSWCYSHKGNLVSTPHVGGPGQNTHPNIKREELGLIEVRSHIWMDVIFVNLSGDAPEFAEIHGTLMDRWKEFDQPLFHEGANSQFQLLCHTNWKLAVENYCESYHLPWVHPGLNSYSRLEDHYTILEEGKFAGQGTYVYRQIEGENGEKFEDFKDLSKKWDTGGEYITVQPNVLLGVQRDHFFVIILESLGKGETLEHIHLYYAAKDTPKSLREKNAEQWKEVFVEDIHVVEGMQAARGAPGYDGGKFSPVMDVPTHEFHKWVAHRLISQRANG